MIDIRVEDGLVVVEPATAPALFASENNIRQVIDRIRMEVAGHTPDLSTDKGRKAIASLSFKVSKSKVVLDDLGKSLVADIKKQASVIDAARKIARDELDALRDEVREPLTAWEQEQERLAFEAQAQREAELAAKKLAEEIALAHELALQEDELRTLRREKEAREREERARIEAEYRAKEEAERQEREERERRELEDRLRSEAEERAKRDAEAKIRQAQEEADRKIREERARQERAEAERLRQEKAARDEAERLRLLEEKKAANKRHQAKINREAAAELSRIDGISEDLSVEIVTAIAKGIIPNITINY